MNWDRWLRIGPGRLGKVLTPGIFYHCQKGFIGSIWNMYHYDLWRDLKGEYPDAR